MNPPTRALELIRFLLDREPTPLEVERIAALSFDCDTFLIELLCSDEAALRYGDITQHLVDHVRAEQTSNMLPHKMAHDIVLAKEELDKLQASLDRLNPRMVELLKQEDRIAGLFDAARELQSQFNALRARLDGMESRMLAGAEANDD